MILSLGFVLLVVGAAGWFLAHRGRRIDDHPLCRRCRYDLATLPPGVHNCSECGRNLARPRAVVIGNRRPFRAAARLALVITAVGLVTAAWGGWSAWQTFDATPWKPLVILRGELLRGSPAQRSRACNEICRRITAGKLAAPDLAASMDEILGLQDDETRPWDPLWGDVVEAAWEKKQLSSARWEKYLAQAVRLIITVPLQVPSDHPLPARLYIREVRNGNLKFTSPGFATEFTVTFRCGEAAEQLQSPMFQQDAITSMRSQEWQATAHEPALLHELHAGLVRLQVAAEIITRDNAGNTGHRIVAQPFELQVMPKDWTPATQDAEG